jgi:hypothetical protein
MPAIITAIPNPVLIPKGQSTGETTITWNGAEQGNCRVYKVVGGVEQTPPVAPIPDPGPPGEPQGNFKPKLGLGTHLYRLKRVAAPNQVVASVSVFVELRNEALFSSVQDGLVGATAIPIQAITRVTVTPQADHAVFIFRTNVPTVPVLEIRFNDPDAGELLTTRFPVFGGAKTEHIITVDDLPQGMTLFFKITAGNPLHWSSPSAVLRGSFRTGRVDAVVIFDRIVVHSDSDALSEGDLTFKFFAGDAETMSVLHVAVPVHQEGLSDGETAFVGKSIHIQKAPPRLWVEVECEDDDDFPLPYPGEGLHPVGKLPRTGPTTGFRSTDNDDLAWVLTELDTLGNGVVHQGVRETPFSMKTGNFPLAFEVFGRLRVNGARGIGFRTDPAIPFDAGIAFGQVALSVGTSGSKKKMAALGPDGAVFYKLISREEPGLPRDEWIGLGGRFAGPLAAVAVDETRISLVAVDAEGAPYYKSYADGDSPEAAWQPLGGTFVGPVAVTSGPRNGIELFGIDREGIVHHRSLEATAPTGESGDWNRLVGEATSALSPVYSPRTGLALFALGRDGNVLHKRRDGREWQPGAGEWESLGGSFQGVLTARLLPEGGVLLVVIGSDRTVHALTWRNYPEERPDEPWKAVGTIDSLFESLGRAWTRGSEPAMLPPAEE